MRARGPLGLRWWASAEEKVAAAAVPIRAEVRRALAAYGATDAAGRESRHGSRSKHQPKPPGHRALIFQQGLRYLIGRGRARKRLRWTAPQQEASKESGSAGGGWGICLSARRARPKPRWKLIGGSQLFPLPKRCHRWGSNVDGTLKPGTLVVDGTAGAFPTAMCAAARRRVPGGVVGVGRGG